MRSNTIEQVVGNGLRWARRLPAPCIDLATVPETRILPALALLEVIQAVLKNRGFLWIVVTGDSMRPTFGDADLVLLGQPQAPRIGDVVLVDCARGPILHRIVGITGNVISTAGDNRATTDARISVTSIVAVAHAAKRPGGMVALQPTFRFGASALVAYYYYRLRARLARVKRRLANT